MPRGRVGSQLLVVSVLRQLLMPDSSSLRPDPAEYDVYNVIASPYQSQGNPPLLL